METEEKKEETALIFNTNLNHPHFTYLNVLL